MEPVYPQIDDRLDTINKQELVANLVLAEGRQAVHGGLAKLQAAQRDLVMLLFADPAIPYRQISRRLGMPMWCLQLLQAWFRRLSWPPARRLLLARRSSWSRSSSADFGASLIDERGHQRAGVGADTVGPASRRRGGRRGGEGLAEAVARGGGQPMSRTWQRILTAKALALGALLVAVATAVIVRQRQRQLDADSSWHPRHEGYPPHVKPGW